MHTLQIELCAPQADESLAAIHRHLPSFRFAVNSPAVGRRSERARGEIIASLRKRNFGEFVRKDSFCEESLS